MLQIAENHFVNGNKVKPPYPDNHERLVVGMGCFWGAERMFWQQEGVYSTSVGYSAGKTTDPTYNEVCSGVTDHAEVVLIVYDTETINLNSLLAIFWEGHNPTQFMRQGNDIGTQYRSIIFYDEDETRQRIESSRDQYQSELEKAGYGKIVTEIQSSEKFFYAEDYHQQYLAKNPSGYCGLGGTGIKCSVAGQAGNRINKASRAIFFIFLESYFSPIKNNISYFRI